MIDWYWCDLIGKLLDYFIQTNTFSHYSLTLSKPKFTLILLNTFTIDYLIGGISIPKLRHVSTNLVESNSLVERPAAKIFA